MKTKLDNNQNKHLTKILIARMLRQQSPMKKLQRKRRELEEASVEIIASRFNKTRMN